MGLLVAPKADTRRQQTLRVLVLLKQVALRSILSHIDCT